MDQSTARVVRVHTTWAYNGLPAGRTFAAYNSLALFLHTSCPSLYCADLIKANVLQNILLNLRLVVENNSSLLTSISLRILNMITKF